MSIPGLILAAPASGSGKTLVTLGLLRALARRGLRVASAKVGPDYIDPAFHSAATARSCLNLDTWAMRPATIAGLIGDLTREADMIVAEGVMGLFDGAMVPGGVERDGSTAALARLTGWPVVLVVNVKGQAASAAATVRGFATHDPRVKIAGVIFNNIGMGRHQEILTEATAAAVPGLRVLGCIPKTQGIGVPERHLGLVQAHEHPDLPGFLDTAADLIAERIDLDALLSLARPALCAAAASPCPLPPLGQRIAVAQDLAFAFCYPAVLAGWRAVGADLAFFSPLANEAPPQDCDAVYLPGGYPELHAGRLAANTTFLDGVRQAVARGAVVFGECGGYMTLGEVLTDAEGCDHPMLGLLPLSTSFAKRRLHMGYRLATVLVDGPFGAIGTPYRAHEFHYATIVAEDSADPLFAIRDSAGADRGKVGQARGRVYGSFMHLIDRDNS
ncbi:MAG: cobyrinate a,c-diamide synthase [Rhodospirillaceae bacterium]|nr:cobyrinate a,c-diamide synthase [Rhodospirillaceae bacterium]